MNNEVLKISSEDLINHLEKVGNIYDKDIKNKLYELENEYKKNKIDRNILYIKYNIPINLIEIINIFQNLDDYNINYINYVLIYNNLNIQTLKNFYRYLMIKWNKVKDNIYCLYKEKGKENIYLDKLNNFKFQDNFKEINNEKNIDNLNNLIINKFKEFLNINDNNFPNIYIFFLINTLQEYLYPI
jgi:hypothetical protein